MLRVSLGRTLILLAAVTVSPAFGSRTHRALTSGHVHASLAHRARRGVAAHLHHANRPIGQRGIDPQRATEIQTALIREHYLSGAPTGQWDSDTEAAMQKFQADHGWQTRLTPDSRALIKLGLGPNSPAGQVNATAATPAPAAPAATPAAESGTLASVHSISQ